jgi:hypothetical protein
MRQKTVCEDDGELAQIFRLWFTPPARLSVANTEEVPHVYELFFDRRIERSGWL